MAKKKKAAVNPARGFATTSVASKPKPIVGEEQTTNAAVKHFENGERARTQVDKADGGSNGTSDSAKISQQLTPEELEEQLERDELQILVDEVADKVRHDAARLISKTQTESRLLRGQAEALQVAAWLPSTTRKRILDLAEEDLQNLPSSASAPKAGPSSEKDVLVKLWTVEKILAGLGFSEEPIMAALKHLLIRTPEQSGGSGVWGVAECLEYLAMQYDEASLPAYEARSIAASSHLHDLDDDLLASPQNSGANSPKKGKPTSTPASTATSNTPDVSDLESDLEPDQLVEKYVEIKARLFAMAPNAVANEKRKGKSARSYAIVTTEPLSPSVVKLQDQLKMIEADVLFDKQDAEIRWLMERNRLAQEEAARRRLDLGPGSDTAVAKPPPSNGTSGDHPVKPESRKDTQDLQADSVSDTDGEELLGGLFMEPTEATNGIATADDYSDSNLKLRDFGRGSGLTPSRVLEDACRSRDAKVKISYEQVSPTTYACRHSVLIKWSKPQEAVLDLDEVKLEQTRSAMKFTVEGIAAVDAKQSEAFVSVAALFSLFSQSSKEEKVYLRMSANWRDVWLEFSELQNFRRDKADREALRTLRTLVREQRSRDEDDDVVLGYRTRPSNPDTERREPTASTGNEAEADLLQRMWMHKASSPSYQSMLPIRASLPIFGFRDEILSSIQLNQIVILCGETGCGKSTQLPAYVLENELANGRPCKIYCTEPRRISAISLAERVSEELGEAKGTVGTANSLVGYAIRLESHVSASTRLVYATVGIVLRMLESSNALEDLTHLVIDEVHERSIDTDFLLIVVKSLLLRRPLLKVILMSATVDAQRFSDYLNGAPILTVPGRTYPVQTYYLEDAIELIRPQGSDEGRQGEDEVEVEEMNDDDKLKNLAAYALSLKGYSPATRHLLTHDYDEYKIDHHLITQLVLRIASDARFIPFSKAFLVFLPGIAEIRELSEILKTHPLFDANWLIYPLHSTIASEEQQQAFVVPPPGVRKVVLATNIAETGITIPDITCVIDCGKHKEMRFDERRQLSRLLQAFIARSNAKQRRGRAGRVQEGICFHLFSKHRHDTQLAENATPEMLRLSLQDLIMRVKICKLGDIEHTLGQALDPPSQKNVRKAIDALIEVGALTSGEDLTALGRHLAKLPLDAILGKLCVLACTFGCLDVAITVAAVLSSKSPFVTPFGNRQQADTIRLGFKRGESDLLTAYNAYAAWRRVCSTPGYGEFAWCRKNFLSPQTLSGIEDLKAQLLGSLFEAGFVALNLEERKALSKHRYSSRHRSFVPVPDAQNGNIEDDDLVNMVITSAFYPKLLVREGKGWRNVANNQTVSLHPTSVNKGIQTAKFMSYYSIMQSSSKFLNAQSTNVAHDFSVIMMAGNAEFRLHAGAIVIDGNRLKFSVSEWKTLLAIKILRDRVREAVMTKLKNPGKPLGKRLDRWMKVLYDIYRERQRKDGK